MTTSLSDLLAQREALERQIHAARVERKSSAVAEIRMLMATHGLTAGDLAARPATKVGAKSGSKVAAKFKNPETGATWSGRGLKPKWLATAIADGRNLQDFAI